MKQVERKYCLWYLVWRLRKYLKNKDKLEKGIILTIQAKELSGVSEGEVHITATIKDSGGEVHFIRFKNLQINNISFWRWFFCKIIFRRNPVFLDNIDMYDRPLFLGHKLILPKQFKR